MTFREQAEKFLTDTASENRSNTLASYRSILHARVIPFLGEENLASIDSATAKSLKDRLIEGGLSPATVNLAVWLMKKVVESATDDRGNRLHRPGWNNDFIRLPRIKAQKTPITPSQTLSGAISGANGEVKALIGLLAGTGLRIGEALALGVGPSWPGNVWDREAGTILVRATLVRGHLQLSPKTEAGNRVVDLHPGLNTFLLSQFPNPDGQLFHIPVRTLYRQLATLGIEGFHSMRRFRLTHQQLNNVPQPLVKYAAGHAAGDVTERYLKVGSEIEARRKWALDAGLGFDLA